MDILLQDLQKSILAMETLSENPATASEHLDELLDQLFQFKTDLMNAQFNPVSVAYQQAASAMAKAASKLEHVGKDKTKLHSAEQTLAEALPKLSKLLDSLSFME